MHDTDPYLDTSFLDETSTTDRFKRVETTLPGVGPRFPSTLPGVGSRRGAPRYSFRADVEAIPLDGRHEGVAGTTEDICHKGVFIKARLRLPLDSLVVLKLRTEHGVLKLTGRVVHNIVGIGFGCEFIDLDDRQQTALNLLVTMRALATPRHRTLH